MPNFYFRLFFNGKPASQERLDLIEEISVEQEVDMAWEARIRFPIYTDDTGIWTGENEDFMVPFSRIRVEVKNVEGQYVPLIDGPVTGFDSKMASVPSESSLTVIVHDDTIYMNRKDAVELFENKSDHVIAEELFRKILSITSFDIEKTPYPPGSLPPVVVRRGTEIQLLRFLAKRQGKYAYVLPGGEPGHSIGCFKSFPVKNSGLPPMILIGKERNLETFNIRYNAELPSEIKASMVGFTDKSITSAKSSFGNIDLLGKEKAFENESDTATSILPPFQGESVDLDQAVAAEAVNSSYAYEASGSVLGHSYPGILFPYMVVSILGINGRLSGDYLISKVTHTLTPFSYSQSFSVKRNARSAGSSGSNPGNIVGSIL